MLVGGGKGQSAAAKGAFIPPISQQQHLAQAKLVWCLYTPVTDLASRGSSPGLCSQQLIVVGGALVVVLAVSDDRGQAFADQGFCNVTGRDDRRTYRLQSHQLDFFQAFWWMKNNSLCSAEPS